MPQGSVLDPLLFILYINDFYLVPKSLKVILFADNTTVFYSGEHLERHLDRVEHELQGIEKWFDANKLSLGKTKSMIFGNCLIDGIGNILINKINIDTIREKILRSYYRPCLAGKHT